MFFFSSSAPFQVEDDGSAVDDQVGELGADPHGPLKLPIFILAIRSPFLDLLDFLGPFNDVIPTFGGKLTFDGKKIFEYFVKKYLNILLKNI